MLFVPGLLRIEKNELLVAEDGLLLQVGGEIEAGELLPRLSVRHEDIEVPEKKSRNTHRKGIDPRRKKKTC